MEVMKKIGAGLLGAFEGVIIAILIMALVFSAGDNKEEEFSINVWWCIVGGVLGAFICACYPPAAPAIFIGLGIVLATIFTRKSKSE